uniref:thiol oxidase n=1 Tax=viral metagenome TaxID=1070528 RepID=A0A6C0JQI1_9ZZZZ
MKTETSGIEKYGPKIWAIIHFSAANYEPHLKTDFKNFIYSILKFIPCKICQDHFKKIIKEEFKLEKYLGSNEECFYWAYMAHDSVNRRLNKKTPSYVSVKNEYYNKYEKCSVPNVFNSF